MATRGEWAMLFRAVRDVDYQCDCGRLSTIKAGEVVVCPDCRGEELKWTTSTS